MGAAVVVRYHGSAAGGVAAFASVVLVVLAAIDLERRQIPNPIVVPAAAVVLIGRIALDPSRWWVWLAASFGAGLAFFVLALVHPAGLGMGDVKLVLLIGAALGSAVLAGLFLGTVAAAIFGVALIARHGREARRRTLAYAPFLCFGALCVMLLVRP